MLLKSRTPHTIMPAVERVPAVICDLKRLLEGLYVEMPGWEPNYVIIDERLKVSRVNVIGVITLVDTQGGGARYTLTDGTGDIALRSYEGSEPRAKPGDLVVVIGRPRVYQNEIYLVPEVIRTIDQNWVNHRKRQLELLDDERSNLAILEIPETQVTKESSAAHAPAVEKKDSSKQTPEEPSSDTERIYAMIESLDSGDGVDLSDVLMKAQSDGIENAEKAIHHMLEMGDIFEIRAGKLKVL